MSEINDDKLKEKINEISEDVSSKEKELISSEDVSQETSEEEVKELTEEEKKELYIKQLKEARVKSHPIKHKGNLTINQFPISYRKERKRKNKIQRQSRKANR